MWHAHISLPEKISSVMGVKFWNQACKVATKRYWKLARGLSMIPSSIIVLQHTEFSSEASHTLSQQTVSKWWLLFTSALLGNLTGGKKKKPYTKKNPKTGTLPMGFLIEKHFTCKNQNTWWECVDSNVFLIGFSCISAQFLSDIPPACLSGV